MNPTFLSNINDNCSDSIQLKSLCALPQSSNFFEEVKNTGNLVSGTVMVRGGNEQNNAGNSLNYVIVSTGNIPSSFNNITNNGATTVKQIVQPSTTTSTAHNYGPPSLIMHSQQRVVSQRR